MHVCYSSRLTEWFDKEESKLCANIGYAQFPLSKDTSTLTHNAIDSHINDNFSFRMHSILRWQSRSGESVSVGWCAIRLVFHHLENMCISKHEIRCSSIASSIWRLHIHNVFQFHWLNLPPIIIIISLSPTWVCLFAFIFILLLSISQFQIEWHRIGCTEPGQS